MKLVMFVACSLIGSLLIGEILLAIPGAWALIAGIIVVGFIAGVVIQSGRLTVGD